MKIIVVGDGHSDIHEVAVADAFKKLGHEVETFFWQHYFQSQNPIVRHWRRLQNKYLIGPAITRLNRELSIKVIRCKPELVFIYRGTHVTSRTLIKIKRLMPECDILGYNNDDPFSPGHPRWLWRHFTRSIPIYDLMLAYRHHNIIEYLNCGANNVKLLRPWYIPEKDYPSTSEEKTAKSYDVIFIGHYEEDNRVECLENVSLSEFSLGIFGPGWEKAPKYEWLNNYQPILPVRGNKYRDLLISAKIALCFLSTLNRDTYTRRCFEIPAMEVLLLCQYTDQLAEIFEDGVDVVFFRNPEEMMQKIKFLMHNPQLRRQIAASGRERVVRDGHDIISRMNDVINFVTDKEASRYGSFQ